MIRTILTPLDGSELAERAVPEACRLAREEAAVIVLVRVVRAAPSGDLLAYDAAVTAVEEYLDRLAAQVRTQGLTVRTDVFVSDPAAAIALAALVHGADVIVMSTHGRSGLGRVVLGSVAETVLQEASIPVLLVRADCEPDVRPASPSGPYRKVLIPLDGTAPAEDALRFVAGHPVTRDAEVLLVHSEQRPPCRWLPACGATPRRWGSMRPRRRRSGAATRSRRI